MQLLANCDLPSSFYPVGTVKQLLTSTQVAQILNVERAAVFRKALRDANAIAVEIEDCRDKQLKHGPAAIRATAEAELERRKRALESVAGAA